MFLKSNNLYQLSWNKFLLIYIEPDKEKAESSGYNSTQLYMGAVIQL